MRKLILLSLLVTVAVVADQCIMTKTWRYPQTAGTVYEIHGFDLKTNSHGTGPFKAYVRGRGGSKRLCYATKGTKKNGRYYCSKPMLGQYIELKSAPGQTMALCYLGMVARLPPKTKPRPAPKPSHTHNCKISKRGLQYRGTKSVTKTGKRCLNWATHPTKKFLPRSHLAKYFPEGNLEDAKNYCRNGDNASGGPWCYTDGKGSWEYCDIRFCRAACRHTTRGVQYRGALYFTKTGKRCLNWSTHPTKKYLPKNNLTKYFPENILADAKNYCRNGDNSKGGPWCYTDTAGKWEHCDIPFCGADVRCKKTTKGLQYRGTKSVTKTGKRCLNWAKHPTKKYLPKNNLTKYFPESNLADAKNYCRNGDNARGGPWCYIDKKGKWEYCDIPICGIDVHRCRPTTRGLRYRGTKSVTKTGKRCLNWATHPTKKYLPKNNLTKYFPESNLADAKNYCRNGDNASGGPWCYIDQQAHWEYCDIPMC